MVRRGEIYLVNFGSGRGSEQSGQRPALVVQNDVGNEFSSLTIVAAMTSREGADYPFHVRVSPDESGLREPSTIMLEQLTTVAQGRLGTLLGRVSPSIIQQVDQALRVSLGILD